MTKSTLVKFLVALAAYFAPVSTMVHCVLIFIALDFLTGVYASYRNKIKIVSHRLRKTIEKFVLYTGSILIAWMFQVEFADWTNLAQVVAGFIAATEMLSIYENINKITGLDILSKVKSLIQDSIKKLISKDSK